MQLQQQEQRRKTITSVACYEVVWSHQPVLLNEERSYTDASIAVVNGCIACILVACDLYSCRINKPQLSIAEWLGECLRNHEETTLVFFRPFFRSWSRYFSSTYFHVFFDKRSNKLLWLFCLFVIFVMKLHFLVFFASGAILSFTEKKSQLASNFKLARTPAIYGEHGIMAHIP